MREHRVTESTSISASSDFVLFKCKKMEKGRRVKGCGGRCVKLSDQYDVVEKCQILKAEGRRQKAEGRQRNLRRRCPDQPN